MKPHSSLQLILAVLGLALLTCAAGAQDVEKLQHRPVSSRSITEDNAACDPARLFGQSEEKTPRK